MFNHYLAKGKVIVHRMFFFLSLSSGISHSSILDAKLTEQTYFQNSHNISLIPMNRERTRKRGLEQIPMVFRKKRRNNSYPSTLIVGSTTQCEMVYVNSALVSRSTDLTLNFTYIVQKNKTKDILDDLSLETSAKHTNFILSGYLFEYFGRLQKTELFQRLYESLDLLRIKNREFFLPIYANRWYK